MAQSMSSLVNVNQSFCIACFEPVIITSKKLGNRLTLIVILVYFCARGGNKDSLSPSAQVATAYIALFRLRNKAIL